MQAAAFVRSEDDCFSGCGNGSLLLP